MLIGSRFRPRPTGSRSHRLALMPVRDAGRCGRGSGGRLASLGGDGQLRLTGSPAIARGCERRPCWGVRAALVGAGGLGVGWTVGQVCHSRSPRLPPIASRCSVRTPLQPIRAFCGPSACRSHRVPQQGPAATEDSPAPGAACRGGAGARS